MFFTLYRVLCPTAHSAFPQVSKSLHLTLGTHSQGGEGGWGVNILEDERHRIALYACQCPGAHNQKDFYDLKSENKFFLEERRDSHGDEAFLDGTSTKYSRCLKLHLNK